MRLSEKPLKSKRAYLRLLMGYSPNWIRVSLLNPTAYMPKMALVLHCIALRRLGEKVPTFPVWHPLSKGD